jgi:hypothetical protein
MVSVMEHNTGCSMKTFHVLCESRFAKRLAQRLLGIKGKRIGRIYVMLVEEYRGESLVKEGN